MQDARAGADRAAPIGTVVLQVQATLTVVVLPEVQPGTTHLIGARRGGGGDLCGGRGRRLRRRGSRHRRHRYRGERTRYRDPQADPPSRRQFRGLQGRSLSPGTCTACAVHGFQESRRRWDGGGTELAVCWESGAVPLAEHRPGQSADVVFGPAPSDSRAGCRSEVGE